MIDVLILAALALMTIPTALWFLLPRLRHHAEHPKHRMHATIKRFEARTTRRPRPPHHDKGAE